MPETSLVSKELQPIGFLAEETQPSTSHTFSPAEKLAEVLSPGNGKNVPSPFKNNLFWPGTPPKSKTSSGKKPKIKLPSVISGKEWQVYEEKRREQKKKEEQKAGES